jgi:hypothetical protein
MPAETGPPIGNRQDPKERFEHLLKNLEDSGCEPINILDDWRSVWMEGKEKKKNAEDMALLRLFRGYMLSSEDDLVSSTEPARQPV